MADETIRTINLYSYSPNNRCRMYPAGHDVVCVDNSGGGQNCFTMIEELCQP